MASVIANLTVVKSTPAHTPMSANTSPGGGRYIRRGQIMFPLNAAGLVGVQIRDGDVRIYPAQGSTVEWATGDGVTVAFEWESGYPITSSPPRLQVRAYNLDDTFNRTIEVRLDVEHITMTQVLDRLAAAVERLLPLRGG